MTETTAYCWRSGLIGFGETAPEGTLPIATGPEKKLRAIVDVLATHCWDNRSLKVGGIATALDNNEAFKALDWFTKEVKQRLAETQREVPHADA